MIDDLPLKATLQEQVDRAFCDHLKADGDLVLLVLDVPSLDHGRSGKALSAVLAAARGRESPLHVMAFIDGDLGDLENQIQDLWKGQVTMVGASAYLDQVGLKVRQYASSFTADVRERLETIANAVGGDAWAKRFSELWWYIELSEKNSAGVPPWWELLRLEAVRARLEEHQYCECIYFGSKGMVEPLGQLCNSLGIGLITKVTQGKRRSLPWLLAFRILSAIFLSIANVLARLVPCRCFGTKDLAEGAGKRSIAFTYFPRSWSEGKEWGDRYYGWMPMSLGEQKRGPVFILVLLDHLNPTTFRMAWQRYRLLRCKGMAHEPYLVLEAYTSIAEILRFHLSLGDILHYLRMRRHRDFRMVFQWNGLDVSDLAEPRVFRSVAFDWPHLQLLERCAERVNKISLPSIAWIYCFEYGTGRALIRGLKAGGSGRVFGLQHGPITPMKFIYAADMRDRRLTTRGGPPVPEPDVYVADGSLARRILEESGVNCERIVVTGAFRLKHVWDRAGRCRNRRRFLGDSIRVLVGLGLHDYRFILKVVWEGLSDYAGLRLIIKAHPKTPPDSVTSEFQMLGVTGISLTQGNDKDIYALMEEADILIGTYSSVVVEALAFGLPIILLKSNRLPDLSPFFAYDSSVLSANDGRTLRSHIDRLISDINFRESYLNCLQNVISDVFGNIDQDVPDHLTALCYPA